MLKVLRDLIINPKSTIIRLLSLKTKQILNDGVLSLLACHLSPPDVSCKRVSEYEYQTESGWLSVKLHLVDEDQEEMEMGPTNSAMIPLMLNIKGKFVKPILNFTESQFSWGPASL